MTNQLEALIAKIKKQAESFDTIMLKEDEAKALIAALEQSESRIHEVAVACAEAEQKLENQKEYYEQVILDGSKRIAELETIRAAAEKLVRCKGRYHSEQNYRTLASLFGVITPYLPPLDGEDSQLSVKLPQVYSMLLRTNFHEDYTPTFSYKKEDVIAALRAAGITVQGDE